MPRWTSEHTFRVSGGVVSRTGSRGQDRTTFRLSLDDELSGTFMLELELTADQFLGMLRGSIHDPVVGKIADAPWREQWGHKRWTDRYEVPSKYTNKLYGEKAEQAAGDWFEEQPGSADYDGYWVSKSGERWQPGKRSEYTVTAYNWLTPEQYAEREAALKASQTEDDDEDWIDDDDDTEG